MKQDISALAEQMILETEKIIVGKRAQIELIVTALFAEGHLLLDDLPGVGKTTLVKTLAIVTGCDSRRIQFVPDLLPSDITGMNVYNQKTGEFQLFRGPVATNILLADEINRAIPRTQAALLEAMEERQVTIDGETIPLPKPFIVMATQNPVESESTFALPAAQMDRFLIRLSLGYPDAGEERQMLGILGDAIPFSEVKAVTYADELSEIQKDLKEIYLSDAVAGYIVDLVRGTREHPLIRMGASPRASRGLYKAAKAWAAMQGRTFVTPDDVQKLAVPVLAHRLMLTNEARLAGKSPEGFVEDIVGRTAVPPVRGDLFHGR
jgi:MoxR-like ATPase